MLHGGLHCCLRYTGIFVDGAHDVQSCSAFWYSKYSFLLLISGARARICLQENHVKQVIHSSQQGLVITVQHLNSNDHEIHIEFQNHTKPHLSCQNFGHCFSGSQAFSCCRMYSSTCQRGRMLAIKKAHFCNFHVQKRQESPCAGSRLSLQAIKGSNIGMYFSLLQLEEGPQRMNGSHTLKNTEKSFKVEYFIRIICSNLGKLRNLKRSRHLQKWCKCQWSTSPWQPLGFCTTANC